MEIFVSIVDGWKSLIFVTKNSILDFEVVLDTFCDIKRNIWIFIGAI